jgi:predicted NAD/FAD-dependent oxidoreductase
MLVEGAACIADWVRNPVWQQGHRWRFARTDQAAELSRPIKITLEGGAVLGLAGEAFAPGGGVQGAWRSGLELARRIAKE